MALLEKVLLHGQQLSLPFRRLLRLQVLLQEWDFALTSTLLRALALGSEVAALAWDSEFGLVAARSTLLYASSHPSASCSNSHSRGFCSPSICSRW